ncbi:regulating synaptic membrane exocytosis protein 2 isoform X4 [Apis cerana]|uniref:regulating synaptic membrane exocytosis protein 2 isoform X4 n=1 Tax=Apis cerana TaxID=7461 RepID=UPI002B234BD5|nr:regulating synaptic membrane exocytosis protein 2 isoform X4 [Apis cerana]
MAAVPDMSHLTPEERSTIEEVIIRQKQEEEKENEIMRRKQDEVKILEERIRACSEKHKKAGVELHATCHICLKTKFADGVGHICNYCSIRCCARCGGKVTLRSTKVIWVCILCRKKQELLSKTGQWITKTGLAAGDNAMVRRMQDMQVGGPPGLVDQTQDKRPKLERAHSAAEKENLPLLLSSGSLLRRQYSQQEQGPGRRLPTSDSGVDMSVSPHSRSLPTPHVAPSHQAQQPPRHPDAYAEDDPNLYRGEIDGLMKQQNYQQRQRPIYPDQNTDLAMTYQPMVEAGPPRSAVHPPQQHSVHQTQSAHTPQSVGQGGGLQPQRSFSSSEEERSTPECASDEPDESEKGKGYYHHTGGPISMSGGGRRHNGPHNGHYNMAAMTIEYNGHHPPREPRKEENTLVRRSFRRSGDEWRADSRRFTERRGKKTVRFDGGTNVGGPQEDWSWEADRQGSQDSATKDSGIDTSSTFTSSEDSNRGDLPKHPWQVSRDGQKIIGHMVLRKQSGSGSSSSILGLKVVGGKLLEDGSMGAVIEKVKKGSTADIEGQLRPGDEVIKWNGRSLQGKSFGEVYDIIAESRQDPQVELVVSRNISSTAGPMATGGPMTGGPMAVRKTAQTQWRQKHPETISGPQHHKGLKKCILWELYDARREKPSVLVTSPGSPDFHARGHARHLRHASSNANVGGNLQVKLSFDPVALRLIVTLICAAGLTPRSNGQPRNPYAKIFLLPDKSEKSKRRTKTLANTNDPKWNQTFVYEGIRRVSELRKRALEITVWDYGKYDTNDFLGEVVLELGAARFDEEAEWHPLTGHSEHRHIGYYQEPDDMVITPVDCHLSPPSTTSRLSDSDTSECDITDCDGSREQRRTADGASISSIGSSSRFHNMPSNYKRHYSSPPPERELCMDGEHRSRRDMSPQGRKRALIRDQPASISGYQTYRKDDIHRGMMSHRSHSAAPMDSPSLRYRGRSQSPTGHRSLSPPEHRSIPYSHGFVPPRFSSRSATATPTGSPKKRQLPLIPSALKERAAQDLEERARFMRHRSRQVHTYRSTGMGGWERHYSGLSDSDLLSIDHDPLSLPHSHAYRMHRPRRGHLSPDKDVLGDLGDSDMESVASVTSSAFSTQSERPRGSRGLIKMRTPFTRSQTVDENMLRYYSPETSEYSVSEGYMLKPEELTGSSKKRIPEIYVEDCLQVDFNDRLIEKFRDRYSSPYQLEAGTRRRSRSWQDRGGRGAKSRHHLFSRGLHDVTDDLGIRNLDVSLRPRRSFLFSKARSFDYDVLHDTYADRYAGFGLGAGMLSRRAKSFEYDTISSNIFSDDSLRTARRKLKKNLAINDAGYGDKIPALGDQSKSYFDSNGDEKMPKILLDREKNYDYMLKQDHKPFYGYDSEFSCGETEIYMPRFDKQGLETTGGTVSVIKPYRPYELSEENSFSSDDQTIGFVEDPLLLGREDPTKRKYRESTGFQIDHDPSTFARDVSEKRSKGLDTDNEHIYCSIDEASVDKYRGRDRSRKKIPRSSTRGIVPDFERYEGERRRRTATIEASSRGRAKSSESYLENGGYDGYVEWDVEGYDDEGFVDRGNTDDYEQQQQEQQQQQQQQQQRRRRRRRRMYEDYEDENVAIEMYEDDYYGGREERGDGGRGRRKRRQYAVTDGEYATDGDYRDYRSAEEYDYEAHSGPEYGRADAAYQENTFPRRRRRRSRREGREASSTGIYENLEAAAYRRRDEGTLLAVPTFSESKRMMLQRAESTPILRSDEELSSSERAERARRLLHRRKRNASCPEARELRYYDPPRRKGGEEEEEEERRTNFILDSDEDFGSMETVVCADCFRERSGGGGGAMVRGEGIGPVYKDVEQVTPRDGYSMESRYDYENVVESRGEHYAGSYGEAPPPPSRAGRGGVSEYRVRRKTSCPECRELAMSGYYELGRSGWLARKVEERRPSIESRHRYYRRRNSSCPEARDLELLEKREEQERHAQQAQRHPSQQQAQQQGSKRNVAISDTLEYYEYSMESESQCSENCGFGPCDPRRPRNRAPHPGNANSSLFDSQTATSDTAKNYHPRAVDHHETSRNTKSSPRDNYDDSTVATPSSSSSIRRHSRKKTVADDASTAAVNRQRDDGRDRRSSSMPESSEYTGQSGSYEKPSRSQPPDSEHDDRKRGQFTRSLSNTDAPQDEKVDGSLSDTAIGLNVEDSSRRGRKSSPGSKSGSGSSSGGGSAVQYQSGLGKKSNSTSQLSATDSERLAHRGTRSFAGFLVWDHPYHRISKLNPTTQVDEVFLFLRECSVGGVFVGSGVAEARAGLSSRKRNSTPSSIQRSEEIVPYQRFESGKQSGSVASDTAGSLNSISSSEGSSWSPSLRMSGETGQLRDFIEDLGPGQVVGRQALGARCLGEIQLSLSQKKGFLEVEVIRAKDLKPKQGTKAIPASYVKVYLVNGKKCIAKAKTTAARKTLDPFYQQSLAFRENCRGCILQVTVWGDYGRLEGKKVFMGIAQIVLDELNLNEMVFGWYKLFGNISLVSGPPSLALSRRSSATSLESFKI